MKSVCSYLKNVKFLHLLQISIYDQTELIKLTYQTEYGFFPLR